MFKGGAKEALVDDIEKALKDNQLSYDQLVQKLQDAEKMMKGLEEVSKAMENNPDYELRKASITKMVDAINEFKVKKGEIQQELQSIS